MHNTSPLQVERPLVQYWCWNVKECGRPARGAFDIPPWSCASQNKQHNSRHLFWQILNIFRIFVEYFWNISGMFPESHNKQDNSQDCCQIFSLLSCPVEGRWIPVMICERSAKVFWLLASPPPSHWQTKTLFGQIHSELFLQHWTKSQRKAYVPKTINGLSFWCWLLKGDDTAHFFSFDSSFDEKVWKHLFFLCAIPDLLAVEVFAWIIEERATR